MEKQYSIKLNPVMSFVVFAIAGAFVAVAVTFGLLALVVWAALWTAGYFLLWGYQAIAKMSRPSPRVRSWRDRANAGRLIKKF